MYVQVSQLHSYLLVVLATTIRILRGKLRFVVEPMGDSGVRLGQGWAASKIHVSLVLSSDEVEYLVSVVTFLKDCGLLNIIFFCLSLSFFAGKGEQVK